MAQRAKESDPFKCFTKLQATDALQYKIYIKNKTDFSFYLL